MDEIDSIGSTRLESGSGGDSEVQRTMLELLNQLDGFEPKQNIKVTVHLVLGKFRGKKQSNLNHLDNVNNETLWAINKSDLVKFKKLIGELVTND